MVEGFLELTKIGLYKCLNCGFVFRTPKIVYRQKALNPGEVYAIDMRALYYPLAVCPRCGSDAIKRIKEPEKDV